MGGDLKTKRRAFVRTMGMATFVATTTSGCLWSGNPAEPENWETDETDVEDTDDSSPSDTDDFDPSDPQSTDA